MQSESKPTESSEKPDSPKLTALRELIGKRNADLQAVQDERYEEIEDVETEDQRFARILETPAAWQ